MGKKYWIWYPGDFELYHAMKQNFSRVERGYGWPAFWKSEGFRNRVVFRRTYDITGETTFCVYSKAIGYVLVRNGEKETKYPFGAGITCKAGTNEISVHAACIESFPCVYIEGDVICSDVCGGGWMAEDYASAPVLAGYSKYYTKKEQEPSVWVYAEKEYQPVKKETVNGGVLFEFETELTAALQVAGSRDLAETEVFCGESREEALDLIHCYYSQKPDEKTGRCPRCAVRYAFIPDCGANEVELTAVHQFVDIPVRAEFICSDTLMQKIFDVASHTFRLCCDVFFLDGIKRDKWIWCGDAYQSQFVNRYLLADADINRRTLLALRGNEPMNTHINTILDYTLFWILGVKEHYDAYADIDFVRQVYRKMCTLMDFVAGQRDEHGFLTGRKTDWVYIDWAEMDKSGPLSAVQILYAQTLKTMTEFAELLEEDASAYENEYRDLIPNIWKYFWDEEKQAFIDTFASGKRHVTRHANLWAVHFGFVKEAQAKEIMEHVVFNNDIAPVTTPYFKFYELDVMCRMGYLKEVREEIERYWGGMLKLGAVTFWEEYDPRVPNEEQYDMYGDRFGKSLCHAWAASPVYLLGRYFAGLEFTAPGGSSFVLKPRPEYLRETVCRLPVGDGFVSLSVKNGQMEVLTDCEGGRLKLGGKCWELIKGETFKTGI